MTSIRPWISDSLSLVLVMINPRYTNPPITYRAALVMIYISFVFIKTVFTSYRAVVSCDKKSERLGLNKLSSADIFVSFLLCRPQESLADKNLSE